LLSERFKEFVLRYKGIQKLSTSQQIEAVKLKEQGFTFREIGKRFGVSHQWIWEVFRKRARLSSRIGSDGCVLCGVNHRKGSKVSVT
jgi:transcriptional regulator